VHADSLVVKLIGEAIVAFVGIAASGMAARLVELVSPVLRKWHSGSCSNWVDVLAIPGDACN
jgi:hypothetical protein